MTRRDPEFASLAHDLSQLLWAIQGRARILAHDAPAELVVDLEAIADDAATAAAMLAGDDMGSSDPEPVLQAAWRQACDRAGGDLWRLSCGGRWCTVGAPAHVLRRVLGNLLANALDAMPDGGAVDCRGEIVDGLWRCTVSDDGPGVPSELVPRLFQQGATAGKAQGHGLGLHGARDLMRRHGGDLLHIPSEVGAAFRLELPLAADTMSTPAPVAAAVPPSRLLVVDDEPSVRSMLAEMLGLDGHTTAQASDHDTALAKFAPGAYDAVLMDLGLPGRSGLELARSLRALDPAVSLILLTGWGREGELAAVDPDLVDDTGVKPLDQPDLRALLARAVARTADRRRGDSEA